MLAVVQHILYLLSIFKMILLMGIWKIVVPTIISTFITIIYKIPLIPK